MVICFLVFREQEFKESPPKPIKAEPADVWVINFLLCMLFFHIKPIVNYGRKGIHFFKIVDHRIAYQIVGVCNRSIVFKETHMVTTSNQIVGRGHILSSFRQYRFAIDQGFSYFSIFIQDNLHP